MLTVSTVYELAVTAVGGEIPRLDDELVTAPRDVDFETGMRVAGVRPNGWE